LRRTGVRAADVIAWVAVAALAVYPRIWGLAAAAALLFGLLGLRRTIDAKRARA
jgi:hypothetical protein